MWQAKYNNRNGDERTVMVMANNSTEAYFAAKDVMPDGFDLFSICRNGD